MCLHTYLGFLILVSRGVVSSILRSTYTLTLSYPSKQTKSPCVDDWALYRGYLTLGFSREPVPIAGFLGPMKLSRHPRDPCITYRELSVRKAHLDPPSHGCTIMWLMFLFSILRRFSTPSSSPLQYCLDRHPIPNPRALMRVFHSLCFACTSRVHSFNPQHVLPLAL